MPSLPSWLRADAFLFQTAPFASCHASTIAESPDGLVAAWFGGTHEGHRDVGIWLARCEAGRWTAPREVAGGSDLTPPGACFNPVLHQVGGGPLWLFYKVGDGPRSWRGLRRESSDGGRTWSPPEVLPPGLLGPIKNKPLVLPDGTLLSGSSREAERWTVHFERSPDGGRSWEEVEPPPAPGIDAIQPSLLTHGGGRLQAVGRSRQGRLFSTWSEDAGLTWSPLELLEVPNPNSGTDAVSLADGRHLLVYNPTTAPAAEWGGPRTPLSLAVSGDGRQWRRVVDLETQPGEYSYPAIIQAADGLVHVTYTWRRQRIRHRVVDPACLPAGEASAFHVKQTSAAGVPPQEE